MVKFLLEFDNKTYIYNHIHNTTHNTYNTYNTYNTKNNTTLLDVFIKTLSDIDQKNLKKNINHYYFIHNNKLLNCHTLINNIIIINNDLITIKCIYKLKGGFEGVEDTILFMFRPLYEPIASIGEFFVMIFKIFIWLVKFVWWLIQFLFWMFTDLLNPINFMGDFFNTLILIVLAVCRIPVDIFMALLTFSINLMGTWMQGFWGWDQSGLTKKDRESDYFKKINKHNNKKCYLTNSNTVPFSVVLGTILCPPIGVFMDMGLTGWLNILVCIFLTLLFYIPGLVYALLVIYS